MDCPALLPERTAILAIIVLAATGFIFRAFGYDLKDVPYVGSVRVVMLGGALVAGLVTSPHHLPRAVKEVVNESRAFGSWTKLHDSQQIIES